MTRKVFISNTDPDEALRQYREALGEPARRTVSVATAAARQRVSAGKVVAARSVPHYIAAAMDGIAVRARDTAAASEKRPVRLEAHMFQPVNTGQALPAEYDAVVMIEDVVPDGQAVLLHAPVAEWQHVRPAGEDMAASELVIPPGRLVGPEEIGALCAAGVTRLDVYDRPRVGILPTGAEIRPHSDNLQPGLIADSNSPMLTAMIEEDGATARVYGVTVDDPQHLEQSLDAALSESDMVLMLAGSSAGTKDFTVHVLERHGRVLVHGVALRPGKPVILAIVDGKPVIGLPGYPVSAWVDYRLFVRPVLRDMAGLDSLPLQTMPAVLARRVPSSFKNREIVRVQCASLAGRMLALPLERGAGVTMSLVRADGYIEIPRQSEGLEAGQSVNVTLLHAERDFSSRLIVNGSHDPLLDHVACQVPLVSSHSGSTGGILALKRTECHLAPVHLIDDVDGSYNINAVRKFFPGEEMVLIKGVRRLQGILTAAGNPLRIQSLQDLVQNEVSFVNRQKGSGTRMLLDYLLRKKQLDSGCIKGYNREVSTHATVAAVIAANGADAGLAVFAAARAAGLEFIPVGYEEYDFLCRSESLELSAVQNFIEYIASDHFSKLAGEAGGYECVKAGQVVKVSGVADA